MSIKDAIDKKPDRRTLQGYFVKNAVPSEKNFADLIDGGINQRDDGIVKVPGEPLSLQAEGEALGLNKVINFYESFGDDDPKWTLSLNPRTVPAKPETAKPGLSIGDATGASKLFIDETAGNIGIGTVTPEGKLEVVGTAVISDGSSFAGRHKYMAPGSLSIGGIRTSYGGGTNKWHANTAGLLLETERNTEIAVHSYVSSRVYSFMYYEAGFSDCITIGRDMGWGTIDNLVLNGNVGVGTSEISEGTRLEVNGTLKAEKFSGDGSGLTGLVTNTLRNSDGTFRFDTVSTSGAESGFTIECDDDRNTCFTIAGRDEEAADLLLQPKGGNVGIGLSTNVSKAKLEIHGFLMNEHLGAGVGMLCPDKSYFELQADNVHMETSLWAEQQIAAFSVIAFSDERMKHVEGRSDQARDLATLMDIEVTDYTYIDVLGKGTGKHKKVIAQQVEKFYPQAVHRSTDAVPDIYQRAALENGWVMLETDLRRGDRVRLIGEGNEGVHEVLEATADRFRTDFETDGEAVFVYGREVNDFGSVDYEAIAMLNVSATQQIKKELGAAVEALRAENLVLRRRIETQEARVATLEARAASGSLV